MKSLRHICVETDQAFKEIYSGLQQGKLEELLTPWVGDAKIVGFNIKPGNRVLIAIENIEDTDSQLFSLIRAFPGGREGWHISIDLNNVANSELVTYLLNKSAS